MIGNSQCIELQMQSQASCAMQARWPHCGYALFNIHRIHDADDDRADWCFGVAENLPCASSFIDHENTVADAGFNRSYSD